MSLKPVSSAHSKHALAYHLVWCVKYRHTLLTRQIGEAWNGFNDAASYAHNALGRCHFPAGAVYAGVKYSDELTERGACGAREVYQIVYTMPGQETPEPSPEPEQHAATCDTCGREFADESAELAADMLEAHKIIAHREPEPDESGADWFGKVFKADGRMDYHETDERPDAETLKALREKYEREAADNPGALHSPGDRWHYLPGKPDLMHNGSYWFYDRPTCEGAVLAQAADICAAMGSDETFAEIHREAYPDEEVYEITPEDRAACARPATQADFRAVCSDLESINYHSFRAAFIRAAELDPDEPEPEDPAPYVPDGLSDYSASVRQASPRGECRAETPEAELRRRLADLEETVICNGDESLTYTATGEEYAALASAFERAQAGREPLGAALVGRASRVMRQTRIVDPKPEPPRPEYAIGRARYAKGCAAVRCPSSTGFKTRAARLAEGLKGRYSNREHAYIMSETKAAKFERLYAEGWDASVITGALEPPEGLTAPPDPKVCKRGHKHRTAKLARQCEHYDMAPPEGYSPGSFERFLEAQREYYERKDESGPRAA